MDNIKLVLLDLDGTLLDGNSKVPPDFDEVVNQLSLKGIRIGIASGRNYASLKYLFPKSFNKMVAITCNGANIYVDGKEIFVKYMKAETTKKVIEITKSLKDASYQLLSAESMICEVNDSYRDLFNMHGYNARWEENIDEHLDDIIMPTVHSNYYPNGFADKYESIQEEVNYASSWYNCVDFMPLGTSKGEGAKIVCDYLNIDLADVIAIGDQDNDLQILKVVGHPVAMKNGNDNVKKIAREITDKSNLEYGVTDYLKCKFLKV